MKIRFIKNFFADTKVIKSDTTILNESTKIVSGKIYELDDYSIESNLATLFLKKKQKEGGDQVLFVNVEATYFEMLQDYYNPPMPRCCK